MPMGIVSDEQFDLELNRVDEGLSTVTMAEVRNNIIPINRGRGNVTEVPDSIRKVIAGCAIKGEGTATEISKEFGVSESSVNAYKHGATSTNRIAEHKDEELVKHNKKIKTRVINVAQQKLEAALDGITIDKINGASLRTLSGVAKDMSTVMKNMEDNEGDIGPRTNINIFAPRMRQEDDYEVIEIRPE